MARRSKARSAPAEQPPQRGARRALIAGLAALCLAALAVLGLRLGSRPAEVRRQPGMNVLLITIDTLRADALGAYGNRGAATPIIDRLAAQGVRFSRAHAQNVVTLPSHANILSGRYPFEHGIRDNAGYRLPAGTETLATLLRRASYHTGAFVSAFPLDSRFGLDRGFDVYDDAFGSSELHNAFEMQERKGPSTVAAARRWLASQSGAPTFCWVHLYEPHAPYDPPEPFASRFAGDPYHGEVAAAAAALAPLLAPLLDRGRAAQTLVVLTADHGESLGEHGERTHGIFAYEATLHIPLIMYQPALLAPRVVDEPVRHVDVLPTILDALALPLPDALPGRSLLPLAVGRKSGPAPGYFEALTATANRGWAPLTGVLAGRWKYIDLPLPELYDLAADPREEHNLIAQRPQPLETLRATLASLRANDRGLARGPLGAEVREGLRSLGYVTGSAPARRQYSEDDDPKHLIGLDAEIDQVAELYHSGDVQGALRLSESIIARRPGMSMALDQLAFLQREAGDLATAVDTARRAHEANPSDTDAASLLGAYLNDAGRMRETIDLLRPFADTPEPDLDVLMALGSAFGQSGRSREALATFERVRRIDPSNAMALVNIGTVNLLAHDFAPALEAFEAALALDPSLARAENGIGAIALQEGRTAEAAAAWQRALRLDPRDYQALYNLGMLLLREGQTRDARDVLERYVREAPPALEDREIARVRALLKTIG